MKIPLLCLDIFLFSQFEQAVNNDQVGAEINYRNSETPLLESVLDSVTGFRTLADYVGTTWPGNAPFKYLVSDLYSEKQPSWNHGFTEALNYIARLHFTQQKRQPKFDAVVYNKDSATDPTFGTHYNETDLIDEVYKYVYLSPHNFALPHAQ
ncbi:hypothetical protein ETB97_002743 [Aspergillus alliaceus]|uniref:Uncharacterized protein n=1 Tax=Petromyces alliaceus TaxID=209559 RepID=A0A8H5ZYZ1_PETAA|nr:hypothetical protein ETB97_002743 [Aspergillus burnettii]